MPFSHPAQVLAFLVDEQEKLTWMMEGLPADELSQQNGALISRASQYPLLVDPQGQVRDATGQPGPWQQGALHGVGTSAGRESWTGF